MVICFDATTEAKRALDALLETGQFRDTSEVISVALTNYEVLQHSVSSGDPSPRRLADILWQFDVTWDLYATTLKEFWAILPKEFDRFRTAAS